MVKTLGDITHNAMMKVYPDGTLKGMVSDKPIFRESGYEQADKWDKEARTKGGRDKSGEDLERARRRARAAVYDIARANDLGLFVTLTLSADVVDRYDMTEISSRLRAWLSNAVQRNGLVYVLVPEYHRDRAIHFHGLFSDALDMQDSGTIKMPGERPRKPRSGAERARWFDNGGAVCYNIPAWKMGFSTAFYLCGDREKAIGYVCKYIGKDSEKIGGRWYLSGGKIKRPEKIWFDADLPDGDADYSISRLGAKIWTFGGSCE